MSRLQIPYDRVLLNPSDFDPERFDSLLRQFLKTSEETPIILEVFNNYTQYLLFLREGQFYWAGVSGPEGFEALKIKDFFSRLGRTQFPQVVVYETNLILYHSLLVFLQIKPDLKISSSLVDLDDLLDTTENEHKNVLFTALQPGNLVMLRYKDGEPVACFHGLHKDGMEENNMREEFLVKVYTMATHALFEINLFTDLVVTHSEDARHIPADHQGSISSYFTSQPPKLIVKLKNRPLKTYTFTGKQLTIGRLPDNDIVIDNLGVSRKHAVIHSWKSGYILKDLGSKNCTYLNDEQIDSAELKSGDVVTIGKYHISFQIPTLEAGKTENLDQTVIIPNFMSAEKKGEITDRPEKISLPPRLFRRSDQEEFVLESETTVIGKGKDCDIKLSGLFTHKMIVEISRSGDDYILQKTSGRKDICINGEHISEKILEEEDLIMIGPDTFVFKR